MQKRQNFNWADFETGNWIRKSGLLFSDGGYQNEAIRKRTWKRSFGKSCWQRFEEWTTDFAAIDFGL